MPPLIEHLKQDHVEQRRLGGQLKKVQDIGDRTRPREETDDLFADYKAAEALAKSVGEFITSLAS